MRAGECIHLRIMPGAEMSCDRAHDVRELAGDGPGWAFRVPCRNEEFWQSVSASGARRWREETTHATCPDRCEPTPEQVAAYDLEVEEAFAQAMAAIEAGRCHICGAAAEPKRRVGRCEYAACGHRIGQVGGDA